METTVKQLDTFTNSDILIALYYPANYQTCVAFQFICNLPNVIRLIAQRLGICSVNILRYTLLCGSRTLSMQTAQIKSHRRNYDDVELNIMFLQVAHLERIAHVIQRVAVQWTLTSMESYSQEGLYWPKFAYFTLRILKNVLWQALNPLDAQNTRNSPVFLVLRETLDIQSTPRLHLRLW